jgi:hypothetical protein
MANQAAINELVATGRRGVLELLSVPALQEIVIGYRLTFPSLKNWKQTEERRQKYKKALVDLIIWYEYGL